MPGQSVGGPGVEFDARAVFDAVEGNLTALQAVALTAREIEAHSDEASAAIPFDEGNGDTPLIRAARFGQLAHVLYLLKDDAAAAQVADKLRQNEEDVEEEDVEEEDLEEEEKEVVAEKTSPPVDQRALMLTQQQQRPAADIEARNERGETALLAAASSQNMQVVQCLTEHGADVHATDVYGNQCLHCSAGVPPVAITRHLLEANADVNASNGGGLTPLHLALQSFMLGVPDDSNRIAMTQLLLSAGAKVDVRDKDGLTPAELGAAANATEETLALLEDHPKAPGP
jgi:ankyrin repeat protein